MKTELNFEWQSEEGNQYDVTVEYEHDPGYWDPVRGEGLPPSTNCDIIVNGNDQISDDEYADLESFIDNHIGELFGDEII